jgi:hypothetical protein
VKVTRDQLFTKHGFPIQGLRYVLDFYEEFHGCKTLEDLQELVKKGEINEHDIYRIRGNGDKRQPGRLAQFLFGAKTREEQRRDEAILNAGAGI